MASNVNKCKKKNQNNEVQITAGVVSHFYRCDQDRTFCGNGSGRRMRWEETIQIDRDRSLGREEKKEEEEEQEQEEGWDKEEVENWEIVFHVE